MKRILLTAEEVVAAGSESSSESINVFIEALGKMKLSEIRKGLGEMNID